MASSNTPTLLEEPEPHSVLRLLMGPVAGARERAYRGSLLKFAPGSELGLNSTRLLEVGEVKAIALISSSGVGQLGLSSRALSWCTEDSGGENCGNGSKAYLEV